MTAADVVGYPRSNFWAHTRCVSTVSFAEMDAYLVEHGR